MCVAWLDTQVRLRFRTKQARAVSASMSMFVAETLVMNGAEEAASLPPSPEPLASSPPRRDGGADSPRPSPRPSPGTAPAHGEAEQAAVTLEGAATFDGVQAAGQALAGAAEGQDEAAAATEEKVEGGEVQRTLQSGDVSEPVGQGPPVAGPDSPRVEEK